jgi:hypothetical protein
VRLECPFDVMGIGTVDVVGRLTPAQIDQVEGLAARIADAVAVRRRVPDPGDLGVVDDAESGTVTYDGASEVARDGVSGFLVLEDDYCPRSQSRRVQILN